MTTIMDEMVAPSHTGRDWKEAVPPVFMPGEADYVEPRSRRAGNVTGHLARLQRLIGQDCEQDEETFDLRVPVRPEDRFEDIIGRSASLRAMLDEVKIVAPTDSTVLILGETGTGKELIAQAIHN